MVDDYTPSGRISQLIVRGAGLRQDVAAAVRSGSISMSTSEATTLEMTVVDPQLNILASRLFDPGGLVDFQDLRMRLQSVEPVVADGVPHLAVVARSSKVQLLRQQKGARTWKNLSPSQVVAALAKSVAAKSVVIATSSRRTLARGKDESSWGMFGRLAGEAKFLCFEVAGTIFFGSLAQLVARSGATRRMVIWDRQNGTGVGELQALPSCRRSEDSQDYVAEMSFNSMGHNSDRWRVGDVARLDGVPTFEGDYLVDSVTIPLKDDPVAVTGKAPSLPASNTLQPGKKATAARFVDAASTQLTPLAAPLPVDGARDIAALVYWALTRVGVRFAQGHVAQLAYVCNRGRTISVEKAMTTRGTLLFTRNRVAISLGDGRVIEGTDGGYYAVTARPAETWVIGAAVPGLAYPKGKK